MVVVKILPRVLREGYTVNHLVVEVYRSCFRDTVTGQWERAKAQAEPC